MFGDRHRPTDKLKPALPKGDADKAKDNVAKLTDMMESDNTKTEFGRLGRDTDACYDKATDTILLAEDYRGVMEQEPTLLEPLLAHERVHALYKGDDPIDEASLQAYVDEEMIAYRAEYEAWQPIKSQYTSPEGRAALDPAGKGLVWRYESKMERIEAAGWDGYRGQLEQMYRRRMDNAHQ
jgi:hypothetical protein